MERRLQIALKKVAIRWKKDCKMLGRRFPYDGKKVYAGKRWKYEGKMIAKWCEEGYHTV